MTGATKPELTGICPDCRGHAIRGRNWVCYHCAGTGAVPGNQEEADALYRYLDNLAADEEDAHDARRKGEL